MRQAKRIAIAGATGMVGQAFLSLLQKEFYPDVEIDLLASKKSKGKKITFRNKEYTVQALEEYDFSHTDLALFSAGASVSEEFGPKAVSQGCVVVDVPCNSIETCWHGRKKLLLNNLGYNRIYYKWPHLCTAF